MARIGYQYSAGRPGAGQAQAFRDFLAANLTTWTVGPMYVFDSGNSERNYFTLTSSFNGEEILVTMPNGISEDIQTSLDNDLVFTSEVGVTVDQSLGLMFSIDGGFEARFLAGDDPNTDTVTFYPNRVTTVTPFEFWFEGGLDNIFYIIEDEANAAFFMYSGYVTNNQGYTYWGYSDDYIVFDRIPNVPAFDFNGNSVVQIMQQNSTANSPRPTQNVSQWWHYTGQTERTITRLDIDYSTPGFLDNLTSSNQPFSEDGVFLSARTQFIGGGDDAYSTIDYSGFIGQLNPKIHRQFGNIVNAYRNKLVSPDGEVFVHLYFAQLTPWAANLPNPV